MNQIPWIIISSATDHNGRCGRISRKLVEITSNQIFVFFLLNMSSEYVSGPCDSNVNYFCFIWLYVVYSFVFKFSHRQQHYFFQVFSVYIERNSHSNEQNHFININQTNRIIFNERTKNAGVHIIYFNIKWRRIIILSLGSSKIKNIVFLTN